MENSQDLDAQKIKRIRIIFVVLVLIFIGFFVGRVIYDYLTTGRIIITTNVSNASITLSKSSAGTDDNTSYIAKSLVDNKAVSTQPGAYSVLVQSPVGSVSQIVYVRARTTKKYTVGIASTGSPLSLVANVNALSVAASSSQIYYVDQSTKNLSEISSQNQVGQLNTSDFFSDIDWANSSYGIGQASTGAGSLYFINNGNISPLTLPVNPGNQTVLSSIAPNGGVYLAIGNKIYSGNQTSGFHLIYTASESPSKIIASISKVLLVFKENNGSDEVNITLLNSVGAGAAKNNVDSYGATWSPSGKYLAVTGDTSSQILNSSLNLVDVIPYNNVNNITWLNDSTLFFTVNNQLWKYIVSSSRSELVANTGTNHSIVSMSVSSDGSFLYMSVENNAGSSSSLVIDRYPLLGQVTPSYIFKIQSELPWLDGRCLLYAINFASPPTIFSYGGQPEDNCQVVAQNYVSKFGISPSNFNYQLTNTPPNEPTN